jgi:hypothetical protein
MSTDQPGYHFRGIIKKITAWFRRLMTEQSAECSPLIPPPSMPENPQPLIPPRSSSKEDPNAKG